MGLDGSTRPKAPVPRLSYYWGIQHSPPEADGESTMTMPPLARRIQRRLESEQGFTLIELLMVLMISGILLSIAAPTYLSFKDKAAKAAVKQDVSQGLRAVQSYANDNFPGSQNDPDTSATDTGLLGITVAAIAKYDAGIRTTNTPFVVNPGGFTPSATDVCLTATIGRWVAAQRGLGGSITVGTGFTAATCIAA
jgi:prepilin-type N-terminal cleavage/methylation domain-containing protein